jgi:hypothetical protein
MWECQGRNVCPWQIFSFLDLKIAISTKRKSIWGKTMLICHLKNKTKSQDIYNMPLQQVLVGNKNI